MMTESCPCTDSSKILSSNIEPNTSCAIIDYLSFGFKTIDPCVNPLYGSSECVAHDLNFTSIFDCTGPNLPAFCSLPWCYVDFEKCRRSQIPIYRSEWFPNLYWSYEACNASSTAYKEGVTTEGLKGTKLAVIVPGSYYPYHFKLTQNGDIAGFASPEYYNDSIPFKGSLIDYARLLQERAEIRDLHFTFKTGSNLLSRDASFEHSIQDIQRGVGDISVSFYSITSERMHQASFTTPFTVDHHLLFIPRPKIDNSLSARAQTILAPFSTQLWALLALTFVLIGTLQIWFANEKGQYKHLLSELRTQRFRNGTWFVQITTVLYVAYEGTWITFLDFFGGATSSNLEDSFPHKIMQFGTAFLTLVSISAYVANLAAFMEITPISFYYDSMSTVIRNNGRICVNKILEKDLIALWPNVHFVFVNSDLGILDALDRGECDVMSFGRLQVMHSAVISREMCNRDFVISPNALLYSNPIGFPVRPNVVGGISYHIRKAQEGGLSFEHIQKKYPVHVPCKLEIDIDLDEDSLKSLSPIDMVFPLFIFLMAVMLSVVVKFCRREKKDFKKALVTSKSKSTLLQAKNSLRARFNDEKGGVSAPSVKQRKRTLIKQPQRDKINKQEQGDEDDQPFGKPHTRTRELGIIDSEDESSEDEIWGGLAAQGKNTTIDLYGKFVNPRNPYEHSMATTKPLTRKEPVRRQENVQDVNKVTGSRESQGVLYKQMSVGEVQNALKDVIVWS